MVHLQEVLSSEVDLFSELVEVLGPDVALDLSAKPHVVQAMQRSMEAALASKDLELALANSKLELAVSLVRTF